MKTSLAQAHLHSAIGQRADTILRKCVHCGFCNATCPTYQLTGDELDGPRGRIYQIKQVLEGDAATAQTQLHLDRCLTCRNCETTCPSGVDYAQLLDSGRHLVEQQVSRPVTQQWFRSLLRNFLLSPMFGTALALGRMIRPVVPGKLKNSIPVRNPVQHELRNIQGDTRVLLITGCVQTSLQPSIDAAASRVFELAGIGVELCTSSQCCGALSHHLSAEQAALQQVRSNIDRWLSMMQQHNIDHITMTASGCGVMIRDYPHVLADDRDYADKAQRIADAYLDPVEILQSFSHTKLAIDTTSRIAFHPPCTLQHGQKLHGRVEALLIDLGYELLPFDESHLCCGSAGTYSITQKSLSRQLRDRKLSHIETSQPEMIITANIGCQTHLQSGTRIPVRHWLELIAMHTGNR